MLLNISSKSERKDSNSILLWQRYLYIAATYLFLFYIVTSQTGHLDKDVMSTNCTAKDSL